MTRPQAWTPETKPLWLISDPDERMRRSVVESLEPQRRPKRTREPSRWPRSTVAAAPQVSGLFTGCECCAMKSDDEDEVAHATSQLRAPRGARHQWPV